MFVFWKNQYCQNDYTTQGNLRVNETLIKLPVAFFTELEQQQKNQKEKLRKQSHPPLKQKE